MSRAKQAEKVLSVYGQGEEKPSQKASQAANRERMIVEETSLVSAAGADKTSPHAIAAATPQSTTNK